MNIKMHDINKGIFRSFVYCVNVEYVVQGYVSVVTLGMKNYGILYEFI